MRPIGIYVKLFIKITNMLSSIEVKEKCLEVKGILSKRLQEEKREDGARSFLDKVFYNSERDTILYGITRLYENAEGSLVRRTHTIIDYYTDEEVYASVASIIDKSDSFVVVWNKYRDLLDKLAC